MRKCMYTCCSGELAEQLHKVLYDAMPIIWFKPTKKCDIDEGGGANTRLDPDSSNPSAAVGAEGGRGGGGRYTCPLYKTTARRGELSTTGHSTNFVLAVLLSTGASAVQHWVKRGAALVTQLDD